MLGQQNNRVIYLVIAVLMVFNFGVSYLSFRQSYYARSVNKSQDKLSGQQFVATTNDENPFGPYFVGFTTLNDRGVSNDELRYIYDVLTNFTMYNLTIYRAKVSLVQNSFTRESVSGLTPKYSFKVGVNDKKIFNINISSDTIAYKMNLAIRDSSGSEKFNKTFDVYGGD